MFDRIRNPKFLGACLAAALIVSVTPSIRAAGISINFGADLNANTPVGVQSAGVVGLGNWNDVSVAQQTNLALLDDAGVAVPGLTLSTAETYTFPASAYTAASNFSNAGDTAMMIGHIYKGGGTSLDLTFTGAIPYSNYDIYVYYNSSTVTNTQTFSILDSGGGPLSLSQVGFDVPGADTEFVLSDGLGGNNANYVKFSGLTGSSIPANFIIRASSDAYSYFNGIQIVEAGTLPAVPTLEVKRLIGNGGAVEGTKLLLVNHSANAIDLNSYQIRSATGDLIPAQFFGLKDRNVDGWDEAGISANGLSELNLTGSYSLAAGALLNLGNAFANTGEHNLQFKYGLLGADTATVGNVAYSDVLVGDANGDNVVDIFDVNVISDNWSTAGPDGDTNWDGVVDIFDVNVVSDHWGNSLEGGVSAVPEPGSWALLTIAAACGVGRLRRRQTAAPDLTV